LGAFVLQLRCSAWFVSKVSLETTCQAVDSAHSIQLASPVSKAPVLSCKAEELTKMTTGKGARAAVYIRISTGDQNPDLQRQELPEYCERRGWRLVETYEDQMSGGKDRRPSLDRLMVDARRRKFDVVAVWRFDRFARSTSHLLRALEEFQSLGVDFVSVREAIDTSTPAGKMVFTVLGAVAELERSIIRERVIAGQRAAKRRGIRFGRPNGSCTARPG
jgi:DNA invertase Pin-like site-specific DNA recombinase